MDAGDSRGWGEAARVIHWALFGSGLATLLLLGLFLAWIAWDAASWRTGLFLLAGMGVVGALLVAAWQLRAKGWPWLACLALALITPLTWVSVQYAMMLIRLSGARYDD